MGAYHGGSGHHNAILKLVIEHPSVGPHSILLMEICLKILKNILEKYLSEKERGKIKFDNSAVTITITN